MKTVAIVQARMGSSRLPGKVMKSVAGKRVIDLLIRRLQQALTVDEIVLATTEMPLDDALADHVSTQGIRVIRGSENDVLSRYLKAIDESGATTVIRITGDCPLIMPKLVDEAVRAFHASNCTIDYLSNTDPPTYPDGLDLEVFTAEALRRAGREAHDAYDREHVTPFLRRQDDIRRQTLTADRDLSALRLTVDEPDDLTVVSAVLEALAPDLDFGLEKLTALYDHSPALFTANSAISRNQGAVMGKGQKLWNRAKRVIPGGNMLLSKRAEMYLPEQWPAYFDRTEGCHVWDLDGKEYIDAGFMAIGTNTLGYSHPEVDAAVAEVVSKGNMSTLNAPEEVLLAEKLVEINSPWAEMVRFARSGGEVNAIAIRIARAASGRDGVAICGYHGWHDWYLSANLADEAALDGHLLPGLSPAGVPRALAGTSRPFTYNDLDGLRSLLEAGDVGTIIMEVERSAPPTDGFLAGVRQLADQFDAVLIFDECSSGFRQVLGGHHLVHGVEPDIAIFGKTLGNGFAINAVIGRRNVMEAATRSFISSTFWTERIGPAAALAALEAMETEDAPARVHGIGIAVNTEWHALCESLDLPVRVTGLPALSAFVLEGRDSAIVKTYVARSMLSEGFLAATSLYASIAHNQTVLEPYFEALSRTLTTVRARTDEELVAELPHGPTAPPFGRLA